MNRTLHTARAIGCLALLLLAAWPVFAQTRHTLTIRDGEVWIDNQRVPADELPASLDVANLQAQFEYVGDTVPMITLNGVAYLLEDGRLREVPADFFLPNQLTLSLLPGMRMNQAGGLYDAQMQEAPPVNSVLLMREHAQAMNRLQAELAMLSGQFEQQRARQLEQVHQQAARQAQVAQELPQLQMRTYFSEVQQQNQELYNLLVREQQLEAEAMVLAREIRSLDEGTARQQHVEALRSKLDGMFELKQENRRREIRLLEQELDALYTRLNERETMRERIIDLRLNELIGVHPSMDGD